MLIDDSSSPWVPPTSNIRPCGMRRASGGYSLPAAENHPPRYDRWAAGPARNIPRKLTLASLPDIFRAGQFVHRIGLPRCDKRKRGGHDEKRHRVLVFIGDGFEAVEFFDIAPSGKERLSNRSRFRRVAVERAGARQRFERFRSRALRCAAAASSIASMSSVWLRRLKLRLISSSFCRRRRRLSRGGAEQHQHLALASSLMALSRAPAAARHRGFDLVFAVAPLDFLPALRFLVAGDSLQKGAGDSPCCSGSTTPARRALLGIARLQYSGPY